VRLNPILRGYRPTNNRLNHGMASNVIAWIYLWTTVSVCIKYVIWKLKVKLYWGYLTL